MVGKEVRGLFSLNSSLSKTCTKSECPSEREEAEDESPLRAKKN